ncbi:MAG: prealbumin-like fold domain-containing protein [Nocardioides sp.]
MKLPVPARAVRRPRILRRRTTTLAAGAALVLSMIVFASSSYAAHNLATGIFELDGNAQNDGAVTGVDWSNLYPSGGAGEVEFSHQPDPAGDGIFTGGGSKDDLPIGGWEHKDGSVPPKDEITNAFAAAYDAAGDLIITFGLDRYSQSGDANVGFWFLQGDLSDPLPADGTFGIEHQDGDILVISGFSGGGDVSTVTVLEWIEGQGTDGNENLVTLFDSDAAECGVHPVGADAPDACGIANQTDLTPGDPAPWPYQSKSGASRDYPTAAFFEGGINLTELLGEGTATPCFSSFVAETRSSTSVDAVLKDLVADQFDLCTVDATIGPDDTNGIGEKHTFTVDTSKSFGGGTPTVPNDAHVDVALTHSVTGGDIDIVPAQTTCDYPTSGNTDHTTDNIDAAGECTITFSSDTAGTVTGALTARINVGTATAPSYKTVTDVATTDTATDAEKDFVDGTLRWLKHDGNGALLGGATFDVCRTHNWDSSLAADGDPNTDPMVEILDGNSDPAPVCRSVKDEPDGVSEGAAGDSPDTDTTAGELQLDGLVLGTYTIKETVAPAGYVIDPDTETVELTLTDPDGGTTDTDPNTLEGPPIFVNESLYKLLVITCNTADETLVDSTVTLVDGDPSTPNTRETLKANQLPAMGTLTDAQRQALICGLAGANYDNLEEDDYQPDVELPDIGTLFP